MLYESFGHADSEISDFTISTWLHVTAPFLLNE